MLESKKFLTKKEEKIFSEYRTAYNEWLTFCKKQDKWKKNQSCFTKEQQKEGDTVHGIMERNNIKVVEVCLKYFTENVIPYILNNPGCLQSGIKNIYPDEQKDLLYEQITEFLRYLWKADMIRREKEGATYKLFIEKDEKEIQEYITEWVKNYIIILNPDKTIEEDTNARAFVYKNKRKKQEIYIPVEIYSNSEQMIIEYFGKDDIKIIFSHLWLSLWNEKHFKRIKNDLVALNSQKIFEYKRFLSQIGGCLKFEINNPLQHIINKYWTKECKSEFKNYLTKFGFFADITFQHKFIDIIGKEKYQELQRELNQHSSEFRIKWCGFIYSKIKPSHIIWDYMQSLKFRWGIKPEIMVKYCKNCGKKFIPVYDLKDIIDRVANNNPYVNNINDIEFCSKHALGKCEINEGKCETKIPEEKMKELLKKLVDVIEIIPPSNFKQNQDYLKGLSKEKYDEAIMILNEMPPFEKRYYSPYGYKDIFGSWFKALIAACVLEKNTRKLSRGYMCLAKDGHECFSIAEKNIDDWLYLHNIEHKKEPEYPGENNFRGDWKVGDYFIEYWGLKGQEDYDKKILVKREIAKKHEVKLIEIRPDDINNLDSKLDILLKK